MTPERAEAFFTRSDGGFRFARWTRPLAPVIFGTDDASLTPLKDGIRETAALAGLTLNDVDAELGANMIVIFCARWSELDDIPHLDRLIPDLRLLIDRLGQAGSNQYRSFAFTPEGSLRACTILLCQDAELGAMSALTLARLQTVQSLLLWSDQAFRSESPLGRVQDGADPIVTPEIAALLRAAYDPVLPAASTDPAHAHRLAARARLLLGTLA